MRCRRSGGFPKSLYYDSYDDKIVYTSSVINQIFEKDIKTSTKIKDKALFERIEKYVINNFGAVISVKSIYEYLQTKEKMMLIEGLSRGILMFWERLKLFTLVSFLILSLKWY